MAPLLEILQSLKAAIAVRPLPNLYSVHPSAAGSLLPFVRAMRMHGRPAAALYTKTLTFVSLVASISGLHRPHIVLSWVLMAPFTAIYYDILERA